MHLSTSDKGSFLIIVSGIIILIIIGVLVMANGIPSEVLFIGIIGILMVSIFIGSGENGLRIATVSAVFVSGIGRRTLDLGPQLLIHPVEVLIWLIFVLLIFRKTINRTTFFVFWMPAWAWIWSPFWLLAWIPFITRQTRGINFVGYFEEFRDFIILLPIFSIMVTFLEKRNFWRTIITAFFLIGALVGGLGALEYYFPSVTARIPFFTPMATEMLMSNEGFFRAAFSFWGGPSAAFLLVITLPMAVALLGWWKKPFSKFLILAGCLLQFVGIYIAGYRSMWLVLIIEIVLWVVMTKGPIIGIYLLIPLSLLYVFIPQSAQERALTFVEIIEGKSIDGSSANRLERAEYALSVIKKSPWGAGWAGTGWVHSDVLQITANQSIAAGLIFVGAYVVTLFKLLKQYFKQKENFRVKSMFISLTLSFVACGVLFASQGVTVMPQYAVSAWFIWVWSEILLRQCQKDESVL